jgi:acetyl-CoA carboxylase biotin carboxyl carrier protein
MLRRRTNKVAKSTVPSERSVSSHRGQKHDDLQDLEKIFELMDKHGVVEMDWERRGERIHLKTRAAQADAYAPGFSFSHVKSAAETAGVPLSRSLPENLTHADKMPSSMNRSSPASSSRESAAPTELAPKSSVSSTQKQVLSPFVGTFYRAASPSSESYVKEGQIVKRGDVLCIIEAMKLMNEIEAEFPGKIVSIMAENGQPVEFGEPLFMIEPT